nr:hypothetical protein [Paraburkholderia sp. BL8N3]
MTTADFAYWRLIDVTFSSAGAGEGTVAVGAFASCVSSALNAALMEFLIHIATAKETNKNAKKECAANHNAKHTANNQAGDLIALETNCFGIFLSRKTDALGNVQPVQRWMIFDAHGSREKWRAERRFRHGSRKAWRKQLYAEKEIERTLNFALIWSMRQRRGDEDQFMPTWQADAGESSQKHGVFR